MEAQGCPDFVVVAHVQIIAAGLGVTVLSAEHQLRELTPTGLSELRKFPVGRPRY
jgi:hypothetical protein